MVAPHKKLIERFAHRMRLDKAFNSIGRLCWQLTASGKSNQRTLSTMRAKRAVSELSKVPIPTIKNTGVSAC